MNFIVLLKVYLWLISYMKSNHLHFSKIRNKNILTGVFYHKLYDHYIVTSEPATGILKNYWKYGR